MNFIKKLFGIKPKQQNEIYASTITSVNLEEEFSKYVSTITPENIEDEFSKVVAILEKYREFTYIPEIENSESNFSSRSKIGGFPYLMDENGWEICPECKKQMHLFLQLNLSDLPTFDLHSSLIIQVFSCLEDFEYKLVKVENKGKSKIIDCDINQSFPEKEIIRWNKIKDYPHHEEYNIIKEEFVLENEIDWLMEERQIGLCIRKDKLFGWPYWEQEARYPLKDGNNDNMKLLFQFISEENLPFMFGDDGIFQIFYDNEIDMNLKFEWSCG